MSFTLQSQIPSVIADLKKNAATLSLRTAYEGQAFIWEEMGKSTPGPSAPGNAPAIDTGALMQSIEVFSDADGFAAIGTNNEYAPFLEYGTTHIAPRPFFLPALEFMKERFAKGLNELMAGRMAATAPQSAPRSGIGGKVKDAARKVGRAVRGLFKR